MPESDHSLLVPLVVLRFGRPGNSVSIERIVH